MHTEMLLRVNARAEKKQAGGWMKMALEWRTEVILFNLGCDGISR